MAVYDQVMLDLETLDTRRDAAIVAIGAVRFSIEAPFEISDRIEAKINLSSGDFGTIGGPTLKWWLEQSQEARDATFGGEGREMLSQALTRVGGWLLKSPVNALWSNGPTFDEVIFQSAWVRTYQGPHVTGFRASRDYRTIREVGAVLGVEPVAFEGVRHSALADAENQALNVMKVFAALRNLSD